MTIVYIDGVEYVPKVSAPVDPIKPPVTPPTTPTVNATFGWPQGQPTSQFTKPVVLGQTLTFLVPIPAGFQGSGKFTVSNTTDTPQDLTFDVWWTQGGQPIALQHGRYPSATLNFTCAPNPPNWQTPVQAASLVANVKITQGNGGALEYKLN
jgi:hypothetical protein